MYVVCQGAGDITVSLSGWVVETSDSDVVIGTSAEAGAKVQNSLLGKGGKSGSIDLRFIKVPLDSTALGPPKGLVWSSSKSFPVYRHVRILGRSWSSSSWRAVGPSQSPREPPRRRRFLLRKLCQHDHLPS